MSKAQLITNNLSYSFDNRTLFENVSLSIFQEDRIGLIGQNGSGKSSLLKILVGELNATNGSVTVNKLIGYFAQNYPMLRTLELTIAEYLLKEDIQLDEIYTTYLRIWLEQLDFDKPINSLSGGEFAKLMFSIMASFKPEVLILDEPTNNLDPNSLERLKEYIKYFQGGIVFVTHNRAFLESVANKLWIFDSSKVIEWNATLSEFEIAQNAKKENILRIYSNQKKEIEKLKAHVSRKLSESKTMDNKFTSRDPYMRKKSGKKSKTAQILNKKLQKKVDALENALPKNLKQSFLELKTSEPAANLILSIKNYKLLNKTLDLNIYYGDKIGIEGPNGSGKTTLCKYIYSQTKVRFNVAYLDQKYEIVDLQKSVWQNMQSFNKEMGEETLRRYLGNFLFSTKDAINQKASTLSGGELARLAFAMVTVGEIELLILDEPVNNIDNQTLEVIIHGIKGFKGTLVVVSHDNFFKTDININSQIILNNDNELPRTHILNQF